jgi:hypothetical protein
MFELWAAFFVTVIGQNAHCTERTLWQPGLNLEDRFCAPDEMSFRNAHIELLRRAWHSADLQLRENGVLRRLRRGAREVSLSSATSKPDI